MRVSDLTRAKPTRATIDLGDGDTVTVTFDRNKVTPRWVEESQERAEQNDPQASSRMLADVIVEWDVTEDDGSPFEPTVANIGRLPLTIQRTLLREIVSQSMPSDAEGKASSEPPSTPPSASAPPAATPPNGQEPSPQPSVSASPSQT